MAQFISKLAKRKTKIQPLNIPAGENIDLMRKWADEERTKTRKKRFEETYGRIRKR